jgi:hypothetical protein
MFPVLALARRRLAIREEREVDAQFAAAREQHAVPPSNSSPEAALGTGTCQ